MPPPDQALRELAALLRAEGTVISDHVVNPVEPPALGELAAAGQRAADARGEYALLFEAIREGYLLHYGEPRIIDGGDADRDLFLLAGDYLYATGLERLAALGDLEAVRELSDLISLSAQAHDSGGPADLAAALWIAAAVAVASGAADRHEAAKRAAREGDPGAAAALWQAASEGAESASMQAALEAACDAIGFVSGDLSHRG